MKCAIYAPPAVCKPAPSKTDGVFNANENETQQSKTNKEELLSVADEDDTVMYLSFEYLHFKKLLSVILSRAY